MPSYVSTAAKWSGTASSAITSADTLTSDVITLGDVANSVQIQTRFDITTNTAGTFTAYLQTSLDEGTTWGDVARISHTGASSSDEYKWTSVRIEEGINGPVDKTDGALGVPLVRGILGDRVRIKTVSTGTYVATFYAWVRSQA